MEGLCRKVSENSIQFILYLGGLCVRVVTEERVLFPTEDEGAEIEVLPSLGSQARLNQSIYFLGPGLYSGMHFNPKGLDPFANLQKKTIIM